MLLRRRSKRVLVSVLALVAGVVAAPRPGEAESTVDALARVGAWTAAVRGGRCGRSPLPGRWRRTAGRTASWSASRPRRR